MKPFGYFALLIAVASVSFSDAGYMRAMVEKDWLITINSSSVGDISLDGFFLVNNSNQRVLTLETNGEALAEGELIKIKYFSANPNASNLVYARALVEVQYKPGFAGDAPVPFVPIQAYGASNFTPEIKNQAYLLSSSSSLATIAALTGWAHRNVQYNISYFGRSAPAGEVFVGRQGVCTEYSHLLLAMLNSLGLKSRFVSGYALQNNSIQPHAWVEVLIGNETIPTDPTFGEAGAISATHIAAFYSSEFLSANKVDLFYGENRSEAFDMVNAKGGKDFNLGVNMSITPLEERDFARVADLNYSSDAKSGELTITVGNPSGNYILLSYLFNSPQEAYGTDSRIILVEPKKTLAFNYPLNHSNIQEGYMYTIPFVASVQGGQMNGTVKYSRRETSLEEPQAGCAPVFMLLSFPGLLLIRSLFSAQGNT